MIKPRKENAKRKNLNRLSSAIETMKKGARSERENLKKFSGVHKDKLYEQLKGEELDRAIKEAQKDPEFMREINKFIKVTTS